MFMCSLYFGNIANIDVDSSINHIYSYIHMWLQSNKILVMIRDS